MNYQKPNVIIKYCFSLSKVWFNVAESLCFHCFGRKKVHFEGKNVKEMCSRIGITGNCHLGSKSLVERSQIAFNGSTEALL